MEIVCFSHLRWDFVYQRPQHLLSRFGTQGSVHFWEEPRIEDIEVPHLARSSKIQGVSVLTPLLPIGLSEQQKIKAQRELLNNYLDEQEITDFVCWFYTPMALLFSEHLHPVVTVYDCMDELSAFDGAPSEIVEWEKRLFARADIVFVGGASLFAAKRTQHGNAHLFPSSIDRRHFANARGAQNDPSDQAEIPRPRVGFYGVLDERLDRDLLRDIAVEHPEWHFILIGPVAKIREDDLPQAKNLHYLGQKPYSELPSYLAGWDIAMLPFAQNASTRFISPTKTPEYLAGGKPVVSTPIQDVIVPYGEMGLVKIGSDAREFAEAIQRGLQELDADWLRRVDDFLALNSWDQTFEGMSMHIQRLMPKTFEEHGVRPQQDTRGAKADV